MGESDRRNLPKRRLLIDARTREAIRKGTAGPQEIDTFRRRALIWVRAHQEGLSPAECQDLISEALLDVFPLIQDPEVDVLKIDGEFRKALGTKRTAAKRRLRRFIEDEKIVPETAAGEDVENEIAQMDHLLKVAGLLKGFIGIAVDLLPSRPHDLIVEEYHLVPLGFSLRNPESYALSEGAYRVALSRARKRFHEILGVVCSAAQTTLREEAASLEASLEDARTLAAFSESGQSILLDAVELLRLVKAAKGFIELAVNLLPDREHDLIIESYGLERLGFELRNPASLFFPKEQDSKMIRQARGLFMSTFEAVLASAQVALEHDHDVIEHALKLVQRETMADILEVIGELEEKASH